jgi:hypothetical protein
VGGYNVDLMGWNSESFRCAEGMWTVWLMWQHYWQEDHCVACMWAAINPPKIPAAMVWCKRVQSAC